MAYYSCKPRTFTYSRLGSIFTTQHRCGSWGCEHCAKAKRDAWAKHLRPLLDGHDSIYRDSVDASRITALQHRINAAKGCWVAVDLNNGKYMVFSTIRFGDAIRMTGCGAAQVLRECISEIAGNQEGRLPVRCCRKWTLRLPRGPKDPLNPAIRITANKSPDLVARICREHGANQVTPDTFSIKRLSLMQTLRLIGSLTFCKGDEEPSAHSRPMSGRLNIPPIVSQEWLLRAIPALYFRRI